MKQLVAILVLICYMLCACDISISFHHCAGELKYLSLNDNGHEVKCCKGKKKMSEDCCKSHTVKYKKSDDRSQLFYSIAKKAVTDGDYTPAEYQYIAVNEYRKTEEADIKYYRPPPDERRQIPLYIYHSAFLI